MSSCCSASSSVVWDKPLMGTIVFLSCLAFGCVGCTVGVLCLVLLPSVSWPWRAAAVALLTYYIWLTHFNPARPELHLGVTPHRPRWFSEHWIWRLVKQYLSTEIEYVGSPESLAQINSNANNHYMFCVHPHGVVAEHRFLFWSLRGECWDRIFPNIDTRDAVASVLFQLPVVREFCLITGCCDARRRVCEKVLSSEIVDFDGKHKPLSLLIYPGGEAEQLLTTPTREVAWVKNRRGTARLSLETGAAMIPVYVFGVSQEYHTNTSFMMGLRTWVRKNLAMAMMICWGDVPALFWVPRRVKLWAVIGEPIPTTKTAQPTDQQIQDHLDTYSQALLKLFNDNKARCGYPDSTLELL